MAFFIPHHTSKLGKKPQPVQTSQLLESENSISRSPQKPKPATGGRISRELQFKQWLAQSAGDEKKTEAKITGTVAIRPRTNPVTRTRSIASSSETGSASLSTNAGSCASSDTPVEKPSQSLKRTVTSAPGGRTVSRPANVPPLRTSFTLGMVDTEEVSRPVSLDGLSRFVMRKMEFKSGKCLLKLLRETLNVDEKSQRDFSIRLHTRLSKLSEMEKLALREFKSVLRHNRSASNAKKDWFHLGQALVACADNVREHPAQKAGKEKEASGSEDSVDAYRNLLHVPQFSTLYNAMRASHPHRFASD